MKSACVGHRGDCFWVVMMLSKLTGPHQFWINDEYLPEFSDLLIGTSIEVFSISTRPEGISEGWIASGMFPDWQYPRDCTEDIMAYVRRYMNLLANAGHDVIADADSMLVELPSIQRYVSVLPFDILAVNADPQSGQAPGWSSSEFDGLIAQLVAKGHRVMATNPTAACPWNNYTFAQIGALAARSKLIIGCATGPFWPCMNVWAKAVPKYVCLHPFKLNYGPDVPIHHSENAEQMRVQLNEAGWL